MRRKLTAVALLGACLLSPRAAQAGLYNTAVPDAGPVASGGAVKPLPFRHFRDNVLTELLQIGIERPQSQARRDYLKRRDQLQARARAGTLTVPERVNLSAYLIRLGQYEEAVEVLTPAAAQEPRNFMVLGNLATAHQLAGRLDRALSYLGLARDVWPAEWPGLSREQLAWYREAEGYQRNLVLGRYRESAGRRTGPAPAAQTLDDLFRPQGGPVRFVSESGRYEAGKLAARERAKLPADALAGVQQLLIWLPQDTRLYWLLGELYNADGDVGAAAQVFEDCVWSRRFDAPELREHRQIVREARPRAEPLALEAEPERPASPPAAEPVPSRPSWLPETRQLVLVGAAAALAVAVLGYLQIREIRRRWRRRQNSGE